MSGIANVLQNLRDSASKNNPSKTLDKLPLFPYNNKANGEVPKWLKGLPC